MKEEASRKKNSIRNVKFLVIYYVLFLLLKFATRTIFIRFFNEQYLGVQGLFSNILGLLTIVELGVGSAIFFSMHKPTAEKDYEKLKALNRIYRNLYFIIIATMLVMGGILMPFLYDIVESPQVDVSLYFVFAIFLLDITITYSGARYKGLLAATQRQDIATRILMVKTVLIHVLQILIIVLLQNFLIFLVVLPILSAIEVIILHIVVHRRFPWLKGKVQNLDPETKKEIKRNIFAFSFHAAGHRVSYSIIGILVIGVLGATGLAILGLYANYLLIIASISMMIGILPNALGGSVGNLIATKDTETVHTIFRKLNFAFFWIVGFCAIAILCLSQDFITLWIGSNWLLPTSTLILIAVLFFTEAAGNMIYQFKNGSGNMHQDKYRILYETILHIGLGILLGYFLGFNGILIGAIISKITGPWVTESFVLFKHYFKKSKIKQYLTILLYTSVVAAAAVATWFAVYFLPDGIWFFVLRVAICAVLPNVIFLIIYSRTKEFKSWLDDAKKILRRKNDNRQKSIVPDNNG